jgi:ethanolamine utilization protein EutA
VADQIGLALRRREVDPADQPIALALRWSGRPVFESLHELAVGISLALAPAARSRHPVVVCVSQDCARGLGHLLARVFPSATQVVCVDGLELDDFDFIDIGAPVPNRPVLPVVVKSLVFPAPDPAGTGRAR